MKTSPSQYIVPWLLSCTWFHGHLPLATEKRRAGLTDRRMKQHGWTGKEQENQTERRVKDGRQVGRSLKRYRISMARKQLWAAGTSCCRRNLSSLQEFLQRQAKCLPNNMARSVRPVDCEERSHLEPEHSARGGFSETVFHHNCPTLQGIVMH